MNLPGTLPASLFNLPNLNFLDLGDNELTGEIPGEVGNATNLFQLYLNGNQLTGQLPETIGNLGNLGMLVLTQNQLSGTIPPTLTQNSLIWIDIGFNQFTDLLALSSLTNLQGLYINDNRFTFEDIEPNVGIASDIFYYTPQGPIGQEEYITLNTGDTYTLTMNCGGEHNQYQWYNYGVPIPGAQSKDYLISGAELTDAGSYHCQVTNTVATELTLYSYPIHVTVIDDNSSQHIFLQNGWNIFSLNVVPENLSMMSLVQPLIDQGLLVKVQSETGAAIEYVPGQGIWINDIGNWSATESYKIKVNASCYLNVAGTIITDPVNISLITGWNIMGYPSSNSQNAMDVMDELITSGSLMKVQDETGAAIEPMPLNLGWINNIGNFEPGEGYKVRMASNGILTIDPAATGGLKAAQPVPEVPQHFRKTWEGHGYDQMNVYVSVETEDGSTWQPGDEIAVYDGNLCVGAFIIENQHQNLHPIIVSADDPTTEEKDGFITGNTMSFKVWSAAANTETAVGAVSYHSGCSGVFEPSGTTIAGLKIEGLDKDAWTTSLGDNYPNPFSMETTIPYCIGETTVVDLSIYDVLGQRVTTLVKTTQTAGSYEIIWDGANNNHEKVKPGIYFCRMVTGNKVLVKTIELID
jgi:hypothetical protein